ncbi:MAG: alanine dehydrogenase [Bacillota bacterium]|nr:alanine dehydrogenase [Bacillota bacterium]
MIIGVPKEIKKDENRVAIIPGAVSALVQSGHKVLIQEGAGLGSGISDIEFKAAGAEIVSTMELIYDRAEMIYKVKEPQLEEYDLLREGQILFTYLHLAAEEGLTKALMEKKVVAIAYETVEVEKTTPLLAPMSEVAGRMATQLGARFLEKRQGGKGILLGGVPGVAPANVVIIGGGIVGINAAKIAVGMGAHVTILDNNPQRLRYLDDIFDGRLSKMMANPYTIKDAVASADLLIGGVLIPGTKAPKLVTEEMVETMQLGSVIIDVAIDQGGCIATIDRTTSHSDPTYVLHGVLHYAVPNIPGAVPRTSTYALNNVTLPYALELANKGYEQVMSENSPLKKGFNVVGGKIVCQAVADAYGLECSAIVA